MGLLGDAGVAGNQSRCFGKLSRFEWLDPYVRGQVPWPRKYSLGTLPPYFLLHVFHYHPPPFWHLFLLPPMLSLLLSFHRVYFNSFSQTHAEKWLPRASHTSVHSCTEAMAVSLIYNYLFRNIQCTLTFAIYSHETSGQHLPALLHLEPAYDLFFSLHFSHWNFLTLTHFYFMWQ